MITECRIVVGEAAFEFSFMRIASSDSIVEIETRGRIVAEIHIDLTETRYRLEILRIGFEIGEEDITSITISTEFIECKSGELAYLAIVGTLGEDLSRHYLYCSIGSLAIELCRYEEVAIMIVRRYLSRLADTILEIEDPSTRSRISLDPDDTFMNTRITSIDHLVVVTCRNIKSILRELREPIRTSLIRKQRYKELIVFIFLEFRYGYSGIVHIGVSPITTLVVGMSNLTTNDDIIGESLEGDTIVCDGFFWIIFEGHIVSHADRTQLSLAIDSELHSISITDPSSIQCTSMDVG